MILGTCNFGFDYNGPQVPKKEVFKILEEFQKLGGGIIDTAVNYRDSQKIINEYVKVNGQENLKIQTKVYEYLIDIHKIDEELKDCQIYSILYRNYFDRKTVRILKDRAKFKIIEKYGQSIYYPHEIRQEANIIQIPYVRSIFFDYFSIMGLYADIQIRSLFNLHINTKHNSIFKKRVLDEAVFTKKQFQKIDFVIGVRNIKQLREDMEFFG